MGRDSKIAWTNHTFNPWIGCTKLPDRPGCANCYAAGMAKRVGWDNWGDAKERRITSRANWQQPLKWDRDAEKAGVRARVFCGSMCDVFEARDELALYRANLFTLIEATPHLDWLLLTKRIDNSARMIPRPFLVNARLGITVENQAIADRDIPKLLALDVPNFLSCEPLLGPIELSAFIGGPYVALPGDVIVPNRTEGIDWVIAGCESSGKREGRPMDLAWVRSLRDQCEAAEVPFFFKQHAVEGKIVAEPELDGRVWLQTPGGEG